MAALNFILLSFRKSLRSRKRTLTDGCNVSGRNYTTRDLLQGFEQRVSDFYGSLIVVHEGGADFISEIICYIA